MKKLDDLSSPTNIMKDCILIKAYNRLLVDISLISGVSLDAPVITDDWIFKEGPLLEKQLLCYLENGGSLPPFPSWVQPLLDRFLVSNDPVILRYIRQLLLFCYKAEYEPTNEQLEASQEAFCETEECIGVWEEAFKARSYDPLFSTARQTVTSLLRETVKRGAFRDIIPSHGPGSVFPARKPWAKSKFLTLYSSIQAYYPYDQFFCGLHSYWNDTMVEEKMGTIREEDDIVASLVAVPKDSRGPRLICVHPSESIWIQQGQRLVLERAITSSSLTKGKIDFTDQTVNGRLALSSSIDRAFVTLDLKEASDRISPLLVRYLFGETAFAWLNSTRATHIKLLDGRVIPLRKWAPMGNCLTFPVQSLIFWALVHAGILCRYGINCTDIYVFGDDILFPSKYHEGALNGLVRAGLVPNMQKTFRKGFFRESCGVDAYHGIDVTPLRVKKTELRTTQGAISLLDLAKRLRQHGYNSCATFIYSEISKAWGKLPLCNNPHANGFLEYVDCDWVSLILRQPLRFNRSLHRWEVSCRVVKSVINNTYTRDWYHVQDSLIRLAHLGDKISDRGTEYPYPYRTRLTYGWAECYMK